MGKALEWLGPDGCATVAGQILRDAESRGGQVWAWCPWHDESSKGGFSYNPTKDVAHCRSCAASGDLIKLFGDINGLDPKAAFVEFRSRYAPHIRPDRRPAVLTPRMPQASLSVQVESRPATMPPQAWIDRATSLTATAHAALLANPDQLSWLSARGITRQTVIRRRLGWLESDYIRSYPAWGLPATTWDNGQERKHKVPRGLLIPMLDGDQVIRMRVRQPDRDPKYYVIVGGAQDPQPLMVLPSTWPGQHQAVVLVEAELDAILLAQAAGDIVTVVALGAAQTRPHDPESHRVVSTAAWVGLWLDRDEAGDKAVRTWTTSTRKADEPADGGLAAALGIDAEDIRPQGQGKMDPGDAHAHGLDIRAHILSSVPPAWRIGPSAIGEAQRGGGDAQAESAERQGPADAVVRLGGLFRVAPLICRYADDGIWIKACKLDAHGQWLRSEAGELVNDLDWELTHWDLLREASRLFWHDPDVAEFLEQHPDAHLGISGRNYWAGMPRRSND